MAEDTGSFPEPSPKTVPEPQPPAARFCMQCGARLPADARFCVACGASTSPGIAPPQGAVGQPVQYIAPRAPAAMPATEGAGMVFVRLLQVLSYIYLVLFVILAIMTWSTPGYTYGYDRGPIVLMGFLILFLGALGWAFLQVIASMAENLIAIRRNMAP